MAIEEHGYRVINIYTYMTLLIFIVIGSISVNVSNQVGNMTAAVTVTTQQIIWDWQ